MIRNLLLWYIPQAASFALGLYAAHRRSVDTGEPIHVFAGVIVGLMFAAAYTGGANLFLSLRSKWIARRHSNARQPAGDLGSKPASSRLRR